MSISVCREDSVPLRILSNLRAEQLLQRGPRNTNRTAATLAFPRKMISFSLACSDSLEERLSRPMSGSQRRQQLRRDSIHGMQRESSLFTVVILSTGNCGIAGNTYATKAFRSRSKRALSSRHRIYLCGSIRRYITRQQGDGED